MPRPIVLPTVRLNRLLREACRRLEVKGIALGPELRHWRQSQIMQAARRRAEEKLAARQRVEGAQRELVLARKALRAVEGRRP